MEPIEPPWQAIKERIPDGKPNLDWFNRPRNPSEPKQNWFNKTPLWQAPEIQLVNGRTLVLESSRAWNSDIPPATQSEKSLQKKSRLNGPKDYVRVG